MILEDIIELTECEFVLATACFAILLAVVSFYLDIIGLMAAILI